MATSTVKLYQTSITPEKNALVEDLESYLNLCPSKTLTNIQYFKHDKETILKLCNTDLGTNFTQSIVDNLSVFNYIKIINSESDANPFYYFIDSTKWLSEKTIQLNLIMDTVNTFQSRIINHFTAQTTIIRQHKNRFVTKATAVSSSNNVLERLIDKTEEGINPPLLATGPSEALSNNEPWILMYIQDNDATSLTSSTYIYAIPKNGMFVGTGENLTYLIGQSCIDRAGTEIIKLIELPYAPFGVHSYDGVLPSVPEGWTIFQITNSTKGFVITGNVLRLTIFVEGSGTMYLNRPFETSLGSYMFDETLVNLDLSSSTAQSNPQVYLSVLNKQKEYESKLYNSEFHTVKFIYDNFSNEIRLEDFIPSNISTDLAIKKGEQVVFYASNNISDSLMFKFNPLGSNYRYMADYEQYLVSNRNLEPVRINSEFINYIRNGYGYDKKAHEIETTANLINFGVNETKNAISAFTSGVEGNYGRMASSFGSMITDATNAISKEMLYENSMQAKLAQLAAQGANVAGTDDLSLLNVYNGNKLLINRYNPTERMQNVIWDAFYYTGYREDSKGIPNLNSRRLFNFIQCDPIFDDENVIGFAKYLDDIKARFNLGVTVFHKCAYIIQDVETQKTWDLNYSGKENWETFICPSIITIN